MDLFSLILFSSIACLFFVFAWRFMKKQDVTLVHDYHRAHVKKEDVPAYTKLYGWAMLSIGCGVLLTGVINYLFATLYGWAAFCPGFALGIGLIVTAQMKYNR